MIFNYYPLTDKYLIVPIKMYKYRLWLYIFTYMYRIRIK